MNRMNDHASDYFERTASLDFDQAHKKAFFHEISSRLTRKRSGLLSFDEIRNKLIIQNQRDIGMKEIPIANIIGSLNRYQDFDDTFLPRQTHTRGRWENIDRVYLKGEYLPPVEVYKLGKFYFVIDGNHRVSVAREKGQVFIDAHVIELELPFSLEGDFNWHELLLKQERADFYQKTGLADFKPLARIDLSLAGQYPKLLEHIAVHRYYVSESQNREVTYAEAVRSWYDRIYLPLVKIIRKKEILRQFPQRTEADLYLWIIEHLAFLQSDYNKEITFTEAADHFQDHFARFSLQQFWQKIKSIVFKK